MREEAGNKRALAERVERAVAATVGDLRLLVHLYTARAIVWLTLRRREREWAKAHAAIVDSFLRGIIAATVYIKNPLNTAAALALIHRHLPIKEEHLRQGFLLYRDQFYSVYPVVTVPGLEFVLRERKINRPAADFYDTSYLQVLQNANFAATVGKSP